MDERTQKIIHEFWGWQAPDLGQALERQLERRGLTQTERANVSATIRFTDWMKREKIIYNDVRRAFRNDPASLSVLLDQEVNRVVFTWSDIVGPNPVPIDQVRTLLFEGLDISTLNALGEMVPLVFSRLDTLDLSHINTDDLGTEELGGFGNLLQRISDTLVNTFPFQGIRRKIILPEIDQEYFSDLGPEELPYISNKEWQLWVEEINTKPNQYIDDKWLERFTGLISCKKLKIDNGMIGDEGLGHIGKLKMLGELELPVSRGNKITTGIGVARLLKDCELLEHYCDVNAVIDGAHLSKLTQPLRMKSLFIDHLDDSGLRVICDICPELEEFMLGGRRITPGALEKLQKLKKLRYLNVEGCDWLDDRSIIEIGKLEALEELHIGSDIDDRGVITDEDLERLGNLSNLKKLSLYGCDGMTRAGLSAFKQKLPNCVIYGEESIVFED